MTIETNRCKSKPSDPSELPESVKHSQKEKNGDYHNPRKRSADQDANELASKKLPLKIRKTSKLALESNSITAGDSMVVSTPDSKLSEDRIPNHSALHPPTYHAKGMGDPQDSGSSSKTATSSKAVRRVARRLFQESKRQEFQSQHEGIDNMLVQSESTRNTARLLAIKGTLYQKLGESERASELLKESIAMDRSATEDANELASKKLPIKIRKTSKLSLESNSITAGDSMVVSTPDSKFSEDRIPNHSAPRPPTYHAKGMGDPQDSGSSSKTTSSSTTVRRVARRFLPESKRQEFQSQLEGIDNMLVQSESIKNTARLLAIKGTLYQKLGEYERAVELLKESIAMDSTQQFAFVRLGETYRLLGDLDQSIISFEKAMGRAGNSAFLYSRYGAALIDANRDLPKAKRLIARSFKMNRNDMITVQYARKAGILSELFKNSFYPKKDPVVVDSNILFRAGYKEYTLGNLSKAMTLFDKAIENDPNHFQSLSARGEVYLMQGMYEQAKRDFEKSIELNPSQSSALLGLANSCIMSGEQTKGINALNQVINTFPGTIIAHIMRGEEFRKQKKYQEAYEDFNLVITTIEDYIERIQGEPMETVTGSQGLYSPNTKSLIEEHKKNLAYAYGRRGLLAYRLNPHEIDAVDHDFDKAFSINPNDTFAWSARGSIEFEKKNYEAAKYHFIECLRRAPNHTHSMNHLGEIARIEKNFEEAKDFLKQSIAANPKKNSFAYERLGDIYRETDETEKALKCLNKALVINPESNFALSCRGDILRSLGRLKEAYRDLNKALGIHKSAFTFANLGEVYRLGGGLENYYRALKAYDEAIALDETFSFAYFCKAKLFAAFEKYDGALENLDRSIQLDEEARKPVNHLPLLLRSNIHLSQENFEEAFRDLVRAQEAAEDQPIVYRYWTMYWYRRGNLHHALLSIEKAIKLDPYKALYYAEKAKIQLFLRDYDEAKTNVERALDRDESQSTALSVLGVLLSLDKNYDEAIEVLQRAISKEPSNGFSHSALGEVYRIINEYDKAKRELSLGIRYSSKSPMPYLLRGILHFEIGDYPSALDDFDQYERNGHHYFAPLAKSKETLDILVRSMRLIIFLQTEQQLYYSESSSDKYQEMLTELNDKIPDIDLEIFRNISDIVLTDEHRRQIQGYIEALVRLTSEDENFYALSSLSILYLLLGDETKMKGTLNDAFNTLKLMPSSPKAITDFQAAPMGVT